MSFSIYSASGYAILIVVYAVSLFKNKNYKILVFEQKSLAIVAIFSILIFGIITNSDQLFSVFGILIVHILLIFHAFYKTFIVDHIVK